MTEEQKKVIRQFFGFLFETFGVLKDDSPIFPVILLNFDYFTKKLIASFDESPRQFQVEQCILDFHEFVLRLAIGDASIKDEYEESIHTFKDSIFEDMHSEMRGEPFADFIESLDIEENNEAPLD